MRAWPLTTASLLALTTTAAAQQQPQPPATSSSNTAVAPNSGVADATAATDTIVVTGSRLKRSLSDTLEPTQIINAQQIETRGYTNIGQALADLPAIAPGINGSGGQSSFGPGQTFVDFFGLGTQRTLTLVNGRHFLSRRTPRRSSARPTRAARSTSTPSRPTSSTGSTSSRSAARRSMAPMRSPAPSTSSSSATTRVSSSTGSTAFRRAATLTTTACAGWQGSTSAAAAATSRSAANTTVRAQQIIINDRRIPSLSEQGIPFVTDFFALSPAQLATGNFGPQPTVTNAAGQALRFDASGALVPIDFGTPTGNLINFSGGNGYSLAPVANLLTPTERYLGNVLAHYQVTDGIDAFVEGWYSRTKGTNLVAQPLYSTSLFDTAGTPNGNLIINLSNPFLTAASRQTIAAALPEGQDTFFPGRANTDLQPGIATGTVDLFRVVAGLDGTFHLGDRAFNWEVVGNFGRSISNGSSPQVITQNFNNAVDAVLSPTGTITCRPGFVSANIPARSSTCAPLNVFGQGNASRAALDYITADATARNTNEQVVATASITGEPFQLPGGGVGLVLGYEHRDERAAFQPGQYYFGDPQPDGTRKNYGAGSNIDPIRGGFYTNEGFGELRLPLVSDTMGWRFIKTFELKAAARYVQNSQAGGDFTWTGGGRLSPATGFTFVGNFTRAIRAPAITEAFNPTSPTFVLANDPCDSRFITGGPNSARRAANCAAAGIVQPFQSNIVDFTSRGSVAGNPSLQNEIANSWTVGVQARPTFVPRLAINADCINIELKNAIASLGAQDIFNACYDATSIANAFCARIDRDKAGQATFVRSGYLNASSIKY